MHFSKTNSGPTGSDRKRGREKPNLNSGTTEPKGVDRIVQKTKNGENEVTQPVASRAIFRSKKTHPCRGHIEL